jgi:hypothetical protein
MNTDKLKEAFSDAEYVKEIAQMSAEDAADSLNERGCNVTADNLMELRDFIMEHKEELEKGELSDESLALVSGGVSEDTEAGQIVNAFLEAAILADAMCIGFIAIMIPW